MESLVIEKAVETPVLDETTKALRAGFMAPKAIGGSVTVVAREETSEMREIARKHLDNKGYVVRITTHREGQNLIGRLHVTDAGSEETIAKLVGVSKVDNLEVVFGIDASEGILREFMSQALNIAEFLRYMVPSVSVKEG